MSTEGSLPEHDAKSELAGLDGKYVRFMHRRADGELIHVSIVDENRGEVLGELRVNRGAFESAFGVVRYA
jgi:hypothetical protein